nr:hypothetical protein [Tanacetum cinerariifolium]
PDSGQPSTAAAIAPTILSLSPSQHHLYLHATATPAATLLRPSPPPYATITPRTVATITASTETTPPPHPLHRHHLYLIQTHSAISSTKTKRTLEVSINNQTHPFGGGWEMETMVRGRGVNEGDDGVGGYVVVESPVPNQDAAMAGIRFGLLHSQTRALCIFMDTMFRIIKALERKNAENSKKDKIQDNHIQETTMA